MERTFASIPFIGGNLITRLAAVKKGHRAMRTGIGDFAALAGRGIIHLWERSV